MTEQAEQRKDIVMVVAAALLAGWALIAAIHNTL